ncbi:MAG: nuclear transport factor 2 family protein [Thermomicrobiales bacterium]
MSDIALSNDTATATTLTTVERFNDALNRHDVDAVMALMTDDCVFENTYPPPDGERFIGQAAVRTFWEGMLRDSPAAHFTTEEIFATGDRCTGRWRYDYTRADGASGHTRGADIVRVRAGKVAEKLSYVKG